MTFVSKVLRRLRASHDQFLNTLRQYEDGRYRDNDIGRDVRLGKTVLAGEVTIAAGSQFSGDIAVGSYSTIDRDCVFRGGKISIGRYSQIGPHVGVYAANHAISYVTIYNNHRLFGGRLKEFRQVSSVDIGHDVWIGHGAIILPSVSIGNGAVIGAGSVVTDNVSHYSVAVGNPARIIKKRFDDEIIDLLSQWSWWNLEPDELVQHESLFRLDLNQDHQQAIEYLKRYCL